ncbi:MAG: class I SAM-dependent methyltransferase [Candidatus Levybacteria bacterium]|nr:class I SAM-dependent methyltransferase [Candidatus Levybacteria bacterium]
MTEYWREQMDHEPTRIYYEKLLEICKGLKPETVLEIGTGWGISGSAFLDSGVKRLMTIDPNMESGKGMLAVTELKSKINGQIVTFTKSKSSEAYSGILEKFDSVYIDGDHGYEGVKFDLENADRFLNDGGYIILDDFFHERNFISNKEDYGITLAVREYLIRTGKNAAIWPTKNNAFIVI